MENDGLAGRPAGPAPEALLPAGEGSGGRPASVDGVAGADTGEGGGCSFEGGAGKMAPI